MSVKEIENYDVGEAPVIISGSHNTICISQKISIDEVALDTFYRRVRWLLTGKIDIYVSKRNHREE